MTQEAAETWCDFWRPGGLCHIRPNGDDRCNNHREDTPTCRYLTLVVLESRQGRRKHAEKKTWSPAT